jgi:hypothetical protein
MQLRHASVLAAISLLLVPPRPVQAADAAPDPAPAAAEAVPAVEPSSEGRELGGHRFMPAIGVVSPFATTSFGTWLTVGTGSTVGRISLQFPGTPPPPPQTFERSVSYAAIGGVLAYEYAFLPGVSARVGFSETLYSGTTGAAVAVVGTNIRVGLGAGLTAGMKLGDSVRLAAVADATYAPRIGLLLGNALRSAYESCSTGVANCQVDFGQLLNQQNVLVVQPGVAAAWAPLRSLGVSGNLSYVYSSVQGTSTEPSEGNAVSVGAAVDFDFAQVSRVPLGLQLTWSSRIPVSSGGTNRFTDVGGGLFYTGRKDLSLGLQIIDRRFRLAPTVDVSWTTLLAFIGMRYYF